jgi:hypothetical protein
MVLTETTFAPFCIGPEVILDKTEVLRRVIEQIIYLTKFFQHVLQQWFLYINPNPNDWWTTKAI